MTISSNIFRPIYNVVKQKIKNSLNSGLKYNQIRKLERVADFETGDITFFEQKVRFSDAKSFLHSVEELFLDEVYKFESTDPAPLIIDCGANIGLSIFYFKRLFPNARIIAFEPDKEIYEILYHNVVNVWQFHDVQLIKKAIWIENTELRFFSEGALAGSCVVDFSNNENISVVEAVDIKSFLNEKISFLKMDIEGAENNLFPNLAGKLKNVENIFLEYHSLTGDVQKLDEILSVLKNGGFRYYIKEAAVKSTRPFVNRSKGVFDMQLNIFSYR